MTIKGQFEHEEGEEPMGVGGVENSLVFLVNPVMTSISFIVKIIT